MSGVYGRCNGKPMPESVTFTNTLYGSGGSGYTNSWSFAYNSTIAFPTMGYKYVDISVTGMKNGDSVKSYTSSVGVGTNIEISGVESIELKINGQKKDGMGEQPGTCSYTLTLHN